MNCPCCGDLKIVTQRRASNGRELFKIRCCCCGLSGSYEPTREMARAIWDRIRVEPPSYLPGQRQNFGLTYRTPSPSKAVSHLRRS